MTKLLESDSESESKIKNEKLTINKKYAKNYEYRKQMEESTMYNDEDDDSDSESSSESEEEDISNDLHFLQTIKALREKNDDIYKSNVRFFPDSDSDNDDDDSEEEATKEKKKSMKIKDVLRREILEQMDKDEAIDPTLSDDEDLKKRGGLMYNEEQQRIRNELLNDAQGGGDDDDLFHEKKSQKNDKELLQKGEEIVNQLQDSTLNTLKDPRGEVDNGDTFLLDYISKKRWIDEDFNYTEDNPEKDNDEDSLEDLEKQEAFESKYNFRFEEQQGENTQAHIPTYSRTIPSSLRRDDDTRKAKRQAKKQRKEEEKRQKLQELKRLKNAKKAELKRRIQLIYDAAGPSSSTTLDNIDEDVWDEILCQDDEFDEEKLQGVMERIFGEEYYKDDGVIEDKNDILRGMEDIIDYEDDGNEEEYEDQQEEEENIPIEEEYDDTYEEADYEEYSNNQQIAQNNIINQKIQDELYKLDYEDMIEDLPCRFKYKKVTPNDYGISPEEILISKDATLRQFVSMKKLAPYQSNSEQHEVLDYNPGSKKRQKFRDMLKEDYQDYLEQEKLVKQNHKENAKSNDEVDGNSKKRRRRQKKKSTKDVDATSTSEAKGKDDPAKSKTEKITKEEQPKTSSDTKKSKKRKRHKKDKSSTPTSNHKESSSKDKKKKKKNKLENGIDVSSSRLASYGL